MRIKRLTIEPNVQAFLQPKESNVLVNEDRVSWCCNGFSDHFGFNWMEFYGKSVSSPFTYLLSLLVMLIVTCIQYRAFLGDCDSWKERLSFYEND